MENRYLFRAKRIDNDEWVYGLPSCNKDGEIAEIEEWDGEDIIFYTVDPSTICQCTGLRDKNDKLIWEKDILMAYLDEDYPEDVTYAKIEWNGSGWSTHENNNENQEYLDDFVLENYEVVGNIFDNPGLLEV